MLTHAPRGVWKLRIAQDRRYTRLIAAADRAMTLISGRRVGIGRRPGSVDIYCHWKHWICLVPQHGPGPKSRRDIKLEAWQENLVCHFPRHFVKGLIESDGCRLTNFALVRGKRYEYPRYFFSQKSMQIQELFKRSCDQIGVDYRQDGAQNISVARRASVAILDEFIGPKS